MSKKILFIPGIVKNICGGSEYQMKLLAEKIIDLDFDIYGILFSKNSCKFVKNKYIKKNILYYVLRSKMIFSNTVYNYIKAINPSIIYQRAGQPFLGIASYYCQRNNCKLIWHIAHELDVIPFKFKFKKSIIFNYIDKKFLEYGIRNSTYIIGQAKYQDQLLRKHYGRKCDLIVPNFHPLPTSEINKELPTKIVWISNFKPFKQPEIFIKLAEEFRDYPNVKFSMIGRRDFGKKYKYSEKKIEEQPNLEHFGEVPIVKVNKFLCEAHIFVNTSVYEGFPNTFIQAWMREVPVVSLNVDPDDVIKKNRIGFHSGSFEQMVRDVKFLVENKEIRRKMGKKAREYAVREHGLPSVMPKYIRIFENLVN